MNKIVSRFYKATLSLLRRKADIPIPTAPLSEIYASLRQAEGYFGMFTSVLTGFGTALSLKTGVPVGQSLYLEYIDPIKLVKDNQGVMYNHIVFLTFF